MYSEILKIIDGGLNSNPQKVYNYSIKFAESLEKDGNINFAKRINKLVQSSMTRTSRLDSLTTKPFDADTHVDTVSVTIPTESDEELFFSNFVEKEISDFLNSYYEQDKFIEMGINSNNRLLLYGKPGTGKTSLARYISLQTNLPLITVQIDGIISSLLGNTAKNIRQVFEYAAQQPCILFLDEFDVLAKVRDDKNEIGELKRVVNSLLQNIDTFSSESILIAATNHQQLLDPAVWRRFDIKLNLKLPNSKVRKEIINYFSKIMENDFPNDLKKINQLVKLTHGLSPAAIKMVFNSAAKKCILRGWNQLKYSQIVFEVYIYKNTNNISDIEAAKFLIRNFVTQVETAELTSQSMREIRKIYKMEKENVRRK